ncbi:hypothetical protein PsYK624_035610 [Phanerochaete sordida]|uniref:Uncharacterized protein n=1 Tax=Phanerochaete sordida TaxID=48140 RepID=A0A9P3LAZ5_9APHY|nr:hypothetical protein PsYK624_035610 [Phanerochaete sordida]
MDSPRVDSNDTVDEPEERPTLRFLVAFLKAKPSLALYIRQLTLKLRASRMGPETKSTGILTLVKLFQKLPNLERLYVEDGLPLRTTKLETPLTLYKPLIPHLKEFRVSMSRGTPWVGDLLQILQLFGEVGSLVLEKSYICPGKRSKIDVLLASKVACRVHSVTFEDTSIFFKDCPHFFTSAVLRSVQRVEIPALPAIYVAPVATFLTQARNSLRHVRFQVHDVHLGMAGSEPDLSYLCPLDFAALRALEIITLELPAYDSRGIDLTRSAMFSVPVLLAAGYDFAVRTLAALAPTLHTVVLAFDFSYKGRTLDRLWNRMQTDLTELEDALLARSLRVVEVRDTTGARIAPEDQRHFRKALRRTQAQGILRLG